MKFKNVKHVDGKVEYEVEMTEQEVAFLTSYAVETLIKEGLISIAENQEQFVEQTGTVQ